MGNMEYGFLHWAEHGQVFFPSSAVRYKNDAEYYFKMFLHSLMLWNICLMMPKYVALFYDAFV